MYIENNPGTIEMVGIELPNVFEALNMWSDSGHVRHIRKRLDASAGKIGLVSICRQNGQITTYHSDGVYELAIFGEADKQGVYSADILNDDGSQRRVKFQANQLGGVLIPVSEDSGIVFSFDEHPGRFLKKKLRGMFNQSPKEILESRINRSVLVNTSGEAFCHGRYSPAIVENCNSKYCEISRLNLDGEFISSKIEYDKFSGILVPEKNTLSRAI